jgi:pimeloyl-ACP methyl ester carboxylesterase
MLTLGDSTFRFEVDLLQRETGVVAIDSEADLDITLAQATVPMILANTEVARLAIHSPAKTWEVPLSQDTLTIGRHSGCDLCLEHPKISRRHARIERTGDSFRIRDLGSTNGTWLGMRRIEEHALTDGDMMQVGDIRLIYKRGFDAEDLTMVEERLSSTGSGFAPSRPSVVFVPGMMGSALWRGSERIWPNVKLMFTQPEIFAYQPGDGIEARGLVDDVVLVPNLIRQHHYGRLGDYLEATLGYERGHDLLEFAYDWRQDLRLSAQQLAATIDSWTHRQPITLIAHSLGCMVSRYYVECLGGKQKVGRLILLGGPHAGYPKALVYLLSKADILPFGLLGDRVRQVIATLPALYQILPNTDYVSDRTGKALNIWSDESWLNEAHHPLLRDARAFRRELGAQTSVPTVSIFGYGLKTITGVRIERNLEGGWQNVTFDLQDCGDTDVPESSAVLPGSEIHPVQQHHGSLYVDNDVKMRLRLELTR